MGPFSEMKSCIVIRHIRPATFLDFTQILVQPNKHSNLKFTQLFKTSLLEITLLQTNVMYSLFPSTLLPLLSNLT